jgi:hypothetical protein
MASTAAITLGNNARRSSVVAAASIAADSDRPSTSFMA